MKIRLHEISEEGETFEWSSETGEADQVLADLIGQEKYRTTFFIKPINGRDYQLTGTLKTRVPELCSRCGIDIAFPVNVTLNEILIPHQPEDRTGRYSKVNHLSESDDSGVSVVEYSPDESFEMGEYLHEQVAINTPFNPAPPVDAKGDCSDCGDQVAGRTFSYEEVLPESKPANPFAALKDLKL